MANCLFMNIIDFYLWRTRSYYTVQQYLEWVSTETPPLRWGYRWPSIHVVRSCPRSQPQPQLKPRTRKPSDINSFESLSSMLSPKRKDVRLTSSF